MNVRSIVEKLIVSDRNIESLFETKGRVYSFVNPYGYHLLRKNKGLYDSLDGLFVDGIFMCLLTKFYFGIKVKRRSFDMTSLAKDCFERLARSGESIYFVGASEEEISATISLLKKDYPLMNIVGYRNGFFESEDERIACFETIVKNNPDFVIVGMGAVLQEHFVVELKKYGYKGIAFTCGGYIRQASTGLDYYPKWVNKCHLRAFYRLFHEKGMVKRLYNILIEFPIVYLCDRIQTKL